ncbi:Uncharacterised protein [Streptococcus pneumoniae]|nr:Uncharacterised protein [Streptococcus pneumoniae]
MYNLFAFAIGVRLLAFIVFVLRLWRKSSICQTGTMTNQVLVKNYLCDSLLAFSPPRDLCRLVCILLWIKCLDALLMLGFLFGNVEIVDLRHENSTPSIKMRWSLHFSKMT